MRMRLSKVLTASVVGLATLGLVGAANAAGGNSVGPGVGHSGMAGPHAGIGGGPRAAMMHSPYGHMHGSYGRHHHFYPGFVFDAYDGYYAGDGYDGCGYYRWKWHETGTRYWRNRYYRCVES